MCHIISVSSGQESGQGMSLSGGKSVWTSLCIVSSSHGVQEHPVNEALFNLVNVWSLMLWPLMLADNKGAKVKNKFGWYVGTQVQYMPHHLNRTSH